MGKHDVSAFLELRKLKINRKEALLFASTPKCKVDISKGLMGPKSNRNMIPLVFDKFNSQNGWISG